MEELQTPLLSALATLATLITTYYSKIKKRFDKVDKMASYIYGDDEKKGAVTRLREMEGKVDDLEAHNREDLDLSTVILKQQEAIKEALKPIYIQLEKKADKELFNMQLIHIMKAIERIGRGN